MANQSKIAIHIQSTWGNQGTEAAKKDTQGLKRETAGIKKEADLMGKAMGVLSKAAAGAVVAAGVAIVKVSSESIKAFGQFDKQIREVFTLLPQLSDEAMGKMTDDVRQFMMETGRASSDAVPALYQAISAGVPPGNVFDFLKVANEAALGGATTLETAVNGLTSVVNAYGADVISTARASDLLFTAVKGGKTTFGEMSSSMYQALPPFAALGLEFGNLTAAAAALTSQGVPTAQTMTQLRQLALELSKDGGKAAETFERLSGKSFKQFIAEGNNLQDALEIMAKGAAGMGVGINDLFSSVEAGNAALGLTGKGAAKFTSELEAAADAAMATADAAAIMSGSLEQQEALARAAKEEFKLLIGEALEPAHRAWLELQTSIVQTASGVLRENLALKENYDARVQSYDQGAKHIEQLEIMAAKYGALVDANGHTTDSLYAVGDAIDIINNRFNPWNSSLQDLEMNTRALEIASNLLANGFTGTGKELGELAIKMVDLERVQGNVTNQAIAYYLGMANVVSVQREAKESTTFFGLALKDAAGIMREAAEAAAIQAAAQAQALAEQRQQLILTRQEQERLAAVTGDYFTTAVNAGSNALVTWQRTVITSGGLTREQTANLGELSSAYERTQANIRSLQGGVGSLGLTEEELNKKLAEQYATLGLLEQAMGPLQAITREVVGVNQGYAYNQSAINQALYEAADAAGASATELALLGLATGKLSEEQAVAALKSAALQEKIKELGQAIAEGMDPQVALNHLESFQNRLDATDFTVRLGIEVEDGEQEKAVAKVKDIAAKGVPQDDRKIPLVIEADDTAVSSVFGTIATQTAALFDTQYLIDVDTSVIAEAIETVDVLQTDISELTAPTWVMEVEAAAEQAKGEIAQIESRLAALVGQTYTVQVNVATNDIPGVGSSPPGTSPPGAPPGGSGPQGAYGGGDYIVINTQDRSDLAVQNIQQWQRQKELASRSFS